MMVFFNIVKFVANVFGVKKLGENLGDGEAVPSVNENLGEGEVPSTADNPGDGVDRCIVTPQSCLHFLY